MPAAAVADPTMSVEEPPQNPMTSAAPESQQQEQEEEEPPKVGRRSIGHYILGKTIGEGTFGKVKLGTHILTGEKVAVKILEKERIVDVADVERVAREIHILKLIRHPHIIQLYEIIETPKQLYLIMEFASGGELFDYIVAEGRVKEREAVRFFHQILHGVEKIHQMRVVHRDLKPENLLLDEHKHIKIVDFGLSNTYQKGQLLKTACGSPCYAAPEMIAGKKYVPMMCDIWSTGVILFALICGYLPFEDQNTAALYKKILNADYATPKFISEQARDLIAGMLTTDPTKRLTVSQIKKHPWYRGLIGNVTELADRPRELQFIPGRGCEVPDCVACKLWNEEGDGPPIEQDILHQLERYGFPKEYAVKCLCMNKHNHVTTTYYLLARRKFRALHENGGVGNIDAAELFPMQYASNVQPADGIAVINDNETSNYMTQPVKAPQSARGPTGRDVGATTAAYNQHAARMPNSARDPRGAVHGTRTSGEPAHSSRATPTPPGNPRRGFVTPRQTTATRTTGRYTGATPTSAGPVVNRYHVNMVTRPGSSSTTYNSRVSRPATGNSDAGRRPPSASQASPQGGSKGRSSTRSKESNNEENKATTWGTRRNNIPELVKVPLSARGSANNTKVPPIGSNPLGSFSARGPGPAAYNSNNNNNNNNNAATSKTSSFAVPCSKTSAKMVMQEMMRGCTMNRIVYKHANSLKLKCQKQNIRFDMEIAETSGGMKINFKRSAGELWQYKEVCSKLAQDLKV